MRTVDIIAKKRDGGELTGAEISAIVDGYTRGEIPDYQAAAWLMAVLLRGMTERETIDLTMAMAASGQTLSMRSVAPLVVDKHSTGGVGDKVTLAVAPLVAAAGLPVAKMSGRGLGFTGGTLDKLESIPGFDVNLTVPEFLEKIRRVGVAVAGQSADLAPADGKFYALRDVTATVPSIPLIAGSVMSKKIAAGADAIVLDVKVGLGAFMKTIEDARVLSALMVKVGKGCGRRIIAVISRMDQPLGEAVGNALEVREAIATLHDRGPGDLRAHCLELAGHMLLLGERAPDFEAALRLARETLESGRGLAKFAEMVAAQGGDARVVDDPDIMGVAPIVAPVPAARAGFVQQLNAERVGLAAITLGAGRQRKGEPVDHRVGVVFHKKVGDHVEPGEALFTIHAATEATQRQATEEILAAYGWSDVPITQPGLFVEVIS